MRIQYDVHKVPFALLKFIFKKVNEPSDYRNYPAYYTNDSAFYYLLSEICSSIEKRNRVVRGAVTAEKRLSAKT